MLLAARPYQRLARELVRLMERERMNQPELAEAIGVSGSYPLKILAGYQRPGPDILLRIARALHADYDALAVLADYAPPADDRVMLPGWDDLREVDKAQIRRLVATMAELNAGTKGGAAGGRHRSNPSGA